MNNAVMEAKKGMSFSKELEAPNSTKFYREVKEQEANTDVR